MKDPDHTKQIAHSVFQWIAEQCLPLEYEICEMPDHPGIELSLSFPAQDMLSFAVEATLSVNELTLIVVPFWHHHYFGHGQRRGGWICR